MSLIADSVVAVGDTVHWKVVARNAAGEVLLVSASVSAADPTVLMQSSSRSVLLGAAAGTTTLSVKVSGYDLPLTQQVRVKDDRPIVALSLGQNVTGTITRNFGVTRYALSLAAGDTIDFMTETGGTVNNVWLRSLETRYGIKPAIGSSTARLIYAAIVAPRSGTYLFDALADPVCSRGCTDVSGDFTLKVRRSAPVFNLAYRPRVHPVPAGGTAVDSVLVQNVGSGTLNFPRVDGHLINPDIQGGGGEWSNRYGHAVGSVRSSSWKQCAACWSEPRVG